MSLKALPAESRPREKLLARGPGALSNAELLALLLRSGLPGKNVLQLAEEVVQRFGGLSGLLHARAEDLKSIKGLGPAKRAEIVAVLELARRALAEQLQAQPLFTSPGAVRDYLQLQLGAHAHEVFAVLFLDSQHRLIKLEEMFRGTLSQTSVYPREVVQRALGLNACSVVRRCYGAKRMSTRITSMPTISREPACARSGAGRRSGRFMSATTASS